MLKFKNRMNKKGKPKQENHEKEDKLTWCQDPAWSQSSVCSECAASPHHLQNTHSRAQEAGRQGAGEQIKAGQKKKGKEKVTLIEGSYRILLKRYKIRRQTTGYLKSIQCSTRA